MTKRKKRPHKETQLCYWGNRDYIELREAHALLKKQIDKYRRAKGSVNSGDMVTADYFTLDELLKFVKSIDSDFKTLLVMKSNRTTLHDDDRMPFGKWKGTRLGEVPDSYWRWFLQQTWASKYPALLRYAQHVESDLDE